MFYFALGFLAILNRMKSVLNLAGMYLGYSLCIGSGYQTWCATIISYKRFKNSFFTCWKDFDWLFFLNDRYWSKSNWRASPHPCAILISHKDAAHCVFSSRVTDDCQYYWELYPMLKVKSYLLKKKKVTLILHREWTNYFLNEINSDPSHPLEGYFHFGCSRYWSDN